MKEVCIVIRTVYRSEDFAPLERFGAWHDAVAQSLMPIAVRQGDTGGFNGTLRQADFGAAQLTALDYSPHGASRTPALVRRSDPEVYVLALTCRGDAQFGQAGRHSTVTEGDLMILDSSLPYNGSVGSGSEQTTLLLLQAPKSLITVKPNAVKRLLGVRLSGQQGVDAVAASTLTALNSQAAACTPRDAVRLGTLAIDVLTALLAHHLDAEQTRPPDSRNTVLLLTIEAFIQKHLADPALSPETVAAAHHISLRHLYHLYEDRETTVAAFIRRQRLDRCYCDLADPALGHLPIHAVAARWGFTVPAHFTRTFRATYGKTPREHRRTGESTWAPSTAPSLSR